MVAETDDREERTEEPGELPPTDSALIAWLGAIHAELRAINPLSLDVIRLARGCPRR